ncbi:hypothetical protein B0H15DRAFT_956634 [Mycena belliarum]|uniref:DUF6534 domain-containing protein n=1 Tax=Mycena belliarum TaxID=1033014 RepID=A0AAD6TRH2_9AGAR|nr:hypothetical protein B0H15DRAFT_956634 [Mycena belliae]
MAATGFGQLQNTMNGTLSASGWGHSGGNFQLMYAPLLFGVLLNVMLLGVFIMQVHTYFHLYKTDYAWIRYLIYYLIILEITNTVCDIGLIYEPLITLRGSDITIINYPTLLAADPIVTTLISTPTQLFMAWRIKLVTKRNWYGAIVAVLAFISLSGGLAATISTAHYREFHSLAFVQAQITTWLASTAFADLFITAFLVNFLWTNKTGFKTQTDTVADQIIFLTVQTGIITSFAAIADCAMFLLVPNTTLMFIWDFSLSKLYSICLISTLNARSRWNGLLEELPPSSSSGGSGSGNSTALNGIIKIRAADDIQHLQLYIPANFAPSVRASPRRRTPHSEWLPRPLPTAADRERERDRDRDRERERRKNREVEAERERKMSDAESARRTAEWARSTGR